MISKKEFHQSVMMMKNNPIDTKVKEEYCSHVTKLIGVILQPYQVPHEDVEDFKQHLILKVLKKDLHLKSDPSKDVFCYYWNVIKRDIWLRINDENKRADKIRGVGVVEKLNSIDDEWEYNMLKELGFKLEDYEAVEDGAEIQDMYNLPVIVAQKPKRGRPTTKTDKSRQAQHWEDMFVLLKKEKQMTEFQLLKTLTEEKRRALSDASKSIKSYLTTIANRDGYKLSVTESGGETIYMLIGD